MLAATFVFLGLSVVAVVALIFPEASLFQSVRDRSQTTAWHKRASWREIKAAYECRLALADAERGQRRKEAARSWSRTFALCASLCLVGVLMEAEYDQRISLSQIFDNLTRPYIHASNQEPSGARGAAQNRPKRAE